MVAPRRAAGGEPPTAAQRIEAGDDREAEPTGRTGRASIPRDESGSGKAEMERCRQVDLVQRTKPLAVGHDPGRRQEFFVEPDRLEPLPPPIKLLFHACAISAVSLPSRRAAAIAARASTYATALAAPTAQPYWRTRSAIPR